MEMNFLSISNIVFFVINSWKYSANPLSMKYAYIASQLNKNLQKKICRACSF